MTGDAAVFGLACVGVLVWETLRQVRIAKLRRIAPPPRPVAGAEQVFPRVVPNGEDSGHHPSVGHWGRARRRHGRDLLVWTDWHWRAWWCVWVWRMGPGSRSWILALGPLRIWIDPLGARGEEGQG